MKYGKSILSGAVIAAFSQVSEAAVQGQVPNVIFFLTDDMGYGDMGCTGHPYLKTPSLDRLANEGTRFDNFFVCSPVCSPSRACFMTGRYPANTGVHMIISEHDYNVQNGVVDWLDPKFPTLGSEFKKAGYATAHFGKWHLCSVSRKTERPPAGAYGFDEWAINMRGADAVSEGQIPFPEISEDPYERAHSTRRAVDHALDFMKKSQAAGKPFFINIWSQVPHAPLKPTPEELSEYADLKVDPNDFPSFMRDYVAEAKNPTEQMRTYCAAVTGMDKDLGYLMNQLKAMGLEDNTIIVFSSDNGPEDYHVGSAKNAGMGSPAECRGRKRSIYEGGVHVPCVVRWPGHVPAGRIDKTTAWAGVDLLPTLLKLAGATCPEGLDGEDVSPALLGKEFARKTPLFWDWRFPDIVRGDPRYVPTELAVQDGKWRAYVNFDGSRLELYDVEADRTETNNVAGSYAEVADRLKKAMLQWKATLPESTRIISGEAKDRE